MKPSIAFSPSLLPLTFPRAVVVDVRLAEKHEKGHAESSVSVPLYRPIQGWDVPSVLRRVAFSLFGIFPGTGESVIRGDSLCPHLLHTKPSQ
jgi:hypothetical protein